MLKQTPTTVPRHLLCLGVIAGLGVWAYFGGWLADYRRGLRRGGWITVGFIVAILLLVAIAFGVIFVLFHNIFFESGTWTFYYSDTLIRLFPERFWRDTFIAIGILAGGSGLAMGLLLKEKKKGAITTRSVQIRVVITPPAGKVKDFYRLSSSSIFVLPDKLSP